MIFVSFIKSLFHFGQLVGSLNLDNVACLGIDTPNYINQFTQLVWLSITQGLSWHIVTKEMQNDRQLLDKIARFVILNLLMLHTLLILILLFIPFTFYLSVKLEFLIFTTSFFFLFIFT